MTPEEKEEIIALAVERAMLLLPETVGHLITNHVTMTKLNGEFYAANPEFKEHKEAVASVMEIVEGENPLAEYKDLLTKAIPRIRERVSTVQGLTTEVSPTPNRDLNGVL